MTAFDRRILVLQGGGALGAYQAGAYEGLAEAGFMPNWVAGVSIGAINTALIAGNPPERRMERLRAFWDLVSSRTPVLPGIDLGRPLMNRMSAAGAVMSGIPGFFKPRQLSPSFAPEGSLSAVSYYDTEPLRATLNELVDFDLLNNGDVRVSLGAANVRTGESVYFDSTRDVIAAEHVMASGALPPGFPPVEVGGEYYWDGGLTSNTPLAYVCEDFRMGALVVAIDLWSGKGKLPQNLNQVNERTKDIQYQSKQRLTGAMIRKVESLRSTLADVIGKLPKSLLADPQVQKLAEVSQRDPLAVIHLVNRQDTGSSDSKDCEFSRATVHDLWRGGQRDIQELFAHPQDCRVIDYGNGVRVFEA
jgi:NTE family protein